MPTLNAYQLLEINHYVINTKENVIVNLHIVHDKIKVSKKVLIYPLKYALH